MPIAFIHDLRFEDLPPAVVQQAKRCLLDLIGVAASGRRTDLSRIVHGFAVRQMGSSAGGARLLFDGRRVSPTGAAYAGAATIDAFDAHDGHRLTKGHAGVALLPALLAVADDGASIDGREFLTSLAMGYEIAIRAGIALHGTAADYHTSGAWNALGCAAIAARILALSPEQTRHALGIAEYHGPRSQMMRCIDHPTMVKDGSGWGALTGVSAAYLAQDGFTGAPAILLDEPAETWRDLGRTWRITEQYFKPWPVCRWAQPAVEAVMMLTSDHRLSPDMIEQVEIQTFLAGVQLGAKPPATTEEAQYALGFPIAAALARGRLGADEIGVDGLQDPAILAMLGRIRIAEDERFTALFPAERYARATIVLKDGRELSTADVTAHGDPEAPLSVGEFTTKFRGLTRDVPPARVRTIEMAVAALDG
ncbi:MAG TPA: MmgE/PrpD family protein, partial [Aliidongia sp.]|uniref:MmgE/PrpD family protein n=1 Tax=Aliidongia sp. TaxID=1914230 RepID=UPI002DDD104F